jgi:hypothetical protein
MADMDLKKEDLERFEEVYQEVVLRAGRIIRIMGWPIYNMDFDGIYNNGEGTVTYNASVYYSGCGREGDSEVLTFDELLQPEQYWVDKKAAIEAEKREKTTAAKERAAQAALEERRRYWLELNEEFADSIEAQITPEYTIDRERISGDVPEDAEYATLGPSGAVQKFYKFITERFNDGTTNQILSYHSEQGGWQPSAYNEGGDDFGKLKEARFIKLR